MFDIMNMTEKLGVRLEGNLNSMENGQGVYVSKDYLLHLIQILKEEYQFTRLADITSVDYSDYFDVVYHLLSDSAELILIKVRVEKNDNKIPSIVSIWKAADVLEREIYDMMGIIFAGHDNLKRILCKEDFEGYPLLKNFKLNTVNRF